MDPGISEHFLPPFSVHHKVPRLTFEPHQQLLGILNRGPPQRKRRDLSTSSFSFTSSNPSLPQSPESCVDPPVIFDSLGRRSPSTNSQPIRRQQTTTST